MPAIKICGVSTPEALDAAIANRAEYCGLVFYPPSPRHVSVGDASRLAAQAGRRIKKVGLFVDPDDKLLGESIAAGSLDAIQLHGGEEPARAAEIRARFGLPVWKAIPVAKRDDVDRADSYRGAADLLLFDARTPGGVLPGGMGLAFDWSLLSGYHGSMSWGLAGGLTPANVAEAIGQTGTPLVDTSSGVENTPGDKGVDRIAAFCKAARSV